MASPTSRSPNSLNETPTEGDERSPLARWAAAIAVLAAVVLVGFLLFGGAGSYRVTAIFENAGQLVTGNDVTIGGRPVGSVKDIALTQDGQAKVEIELDEQRPLHRGTTAVVRATSLSGIANRYVSLQPGPDNRAEIPDGGRIEADSTTAPVDLDQLFNTLDPATRKGLQQIIQGGARQYSGRTKKANAALHYLNPALSTSSRLTRELVVDQTAFRGFVTDTSRTVGALAQRRDDLTNLVTNTNTTMAAIGDENAALARSLGLLPGTLRKANTTFVNLRGALDDLDRLVSVSKPATRRLAPFLAALRPLVADARPTIRDLRVLVHKRGVDNDLIDLTRKMPRLRSLTSTVFPRSIKALQKAQPVVEYARPYSPDLVGWFTKFGEGAANYDANGHYARIQPIFNAFSLGDNGAGPVLNPTDPATRLAGLDLGNSQRCPGGAMQPPPDGSAPWKPTPDFSCDPTTTPPGP
ncbi:MAG: phospholipid/cholesterol/gamma-HCH transport system substrate-binding protein [Thermoleophilaceae bacterium]|nr:phospholipid/cholesterol/gamma-HCH transport system substrate-binding protein [Thermoleophilaceae bacterium]